MGPLPQALAEAGEPQIPALAERCASQDGKHNIPAYPASVLPQQEAEALDCERVEAKFVICPYLLLPWWGTTGSGATALTYIWDH